MRVDTTVVETNIHPPTDSTLLGDGVRVLTRTMRKISEIAGAVGAKLRDRSRSVKLRLLEIARTARERPAQSREAAARLPPAVGFGEPRDRSGEALFQGDCQRSEASQ
jgi:IS5 family transposase